MRRFHSQGFTLIEVLVALAVLALGMMAVVKALSEYSDQAAYTEQKTLASWIATNKLTELSVGPAWPQLGDSDEDVEFASQQWRCTIKVSKTDVTNLRRVDVSVSLLKEPDRVIHKVSALIEQPAPPGFLSPQWSLPQGGGEGGGRGERG
jgi:general secretion pathway protein I